MHIFATIGAWVAVPFIAVAALFGFHTATHQLNMAPNVFVSSSTQSTTGASAAATSSVTIGLKPPADHPTQPEPAEPAAPQSAVELDALSQTSASVGDTITLTGSGFIADNNVLFDGWLAASDVHLSSFTNGHQSITFTVPDALTVNCASGTVCPMIAARLLTPRTYLISIENDNGTSNTLSLTVTGSTVRPY